MPTKKKPAQFARPSIDLGGTRVKRDWQWVSPEVLDSGDTLADFGTVDKVVLRRKYQDKGTLIVDEIESGLQPLASIEVIRLLPDYASKMFEPTDVVHAFTKTKD